MSAAALLDRLDGVKRTGEGRWIARCPAHDDKRPSLSIRELDDGRVLVHDFAALLRTAGTQCEIAERRGLDDVGIL